MLSFVIGVRLVGWMSDRSGGRLAGWGVGEAKTWGVRIAVSERMRYVRRDIVLRWGGRRALEESCAFRVSYVGQK